MSRYFEEDKRDLMLSAIDVCKTFSQGRYKIGAVKNINLHIEKGSAVAIIGPSGAGKSTLLHIMGGLETPTKGSVLFENNDLYRLNDGKRSRLRNRRIGFVFQFYNLLSEFTVLENVMMPVLINRESVYTGKGIRNRAESLLRRMNLEHRLRHKPRELSGGEAQRVAIARALINEPDIIYCDEPTGNLDSVMGGEIFHLLKEMSREKHMSVVVVTHHLPENFVFDKTYYMKDGEIIDCVSAKKTVEKIAV